MLKQPMTETCLTCQAPLYHDFQLHFLWAKRPRFSVLCAQCQMEWDRMRFKKTELSCQACGVPLDPTVKQKPSDLCSDCVRWSQWYDRDLLWHDACYMYGDLLSNWLIDFKTRGDVRLASVVAESLYSFYQQFRSAQWIVLPSSPHSLSERGFHQTALLLDIAEIPYESPLVYVGDGQKQALKNRQQRLEMPQPFQLIDDLTVGRNVTEWLVFDDVYTTGRTVLHAKNLLRQQFPSAIIHSLSVARGIPFHGNKV